MASGDFSRHSLASTARLERLHSRLSPAQYGEPATGGTFGGTGESVGSAAEHEGVGEQGVPPPLSHSSSSPSFSSRRATSDASACAPVSSPILSRGELSREELSREGMRLLELHLESPKSDNDASIQHVDHVDIWCERCDADGNQLRLAPNSLRRNRRVVLAAVRENGHALQWASGVLQADKEVVMHAVQNYGLSLQWATSALRQDADVVHSAVCNHGKALMYARSAPSWQRSDTGQCKEYRADFDTVLAAVSTHGDALQYASRRLKASREIVLAAVANRGDALRYADSSLCDDREIVLAALAAVEDTAPRGHASRRQSGVHILNHVKPRLTATATRGTQSIDPLKARLELFERWHRPIAEVQRQNLQRTTLTLCKLYDWHGKSIVSKAAAMQIMKYLGAIDDEQMALLLESWEGLGLTEELQLHSRFSGAQERKSGRLNSSMRRASSTRATCEERDVQMLVKGVWLWKHGRRGKPKWRKVRVDKSLTAVFWGTGKQISVQDITSVQKGFSGPVLERTGRSEDAQLYVSIVSEGRSLDMQLTSTQERDALARAFLALVALQTADGKSLKSEDEISASVANAPDDVSAFDGEVLHPSDIRHEHLGSS